MAIGELLSAIEREAAAEERTLRETASADAARVLGEAARARAHDIDASLRTFRDERRRRADRVVSAAERRWRGETLAAHAAALERVRAATRAALPKLLDAQVAAVLLDAALAALGDDGGEGTLHCTPGIAPAVRARVAGRAGLRIEDDLAAAGVVIERADGTVRIDATLEALLDGAWSELRQGALVEDAT